MSERAASKGALHQLALTAWCVWACLLISTPYYFSDPNQGSLLSSEYVYVAIGFIAGSSTFLAAFNSGHGRHRSIYVILFIVATALISMGIFAVEWLSIPVYLKFGPDSVVESPYYSTMSKYAPIALLLASSGCALAGAYATGLGRKDAKESLDAWEARLLGRLFFVGLGICFVWGFVRVLAWAPFLPESLFGATLVRGSALKLAIPLAETMFCLIAILLLAKGLLSNWNECSSELLAWALIAVSAGMLSWNLFTRVVPVFGEPLYLMGGWAFVLQSALPVLLIVCGRITIEIEEDEKGDQDFSGVSDDCLRKLADAGFESKTPIASTFFGEKGLSRREAEAVSLVFEGMNSTQAAERMGIRPSTVRSLLQRAYRKMGVEGLDDLSDLVSLMQQTDSVTSSHLETERVPLASSVMVGIASGSAIAIIAGIFLPFHASSMVWGEERMAFFASSVACFLWGASKVADYWRRACWPFSPFALVSCRPSLGWPSLSKIAPLLLLLVFGCLAVACFYYERKFGLSNSVFDAVFCLCSISFLLSLLDHIRLLARSIRSGKVSRVIGSVSAVTLAATLMSVMSISVDSWGCAMLFSVALVCISGAYLRGRDFPVVERTVVVGRRDFQMAALSSALCLAASLIAGCLWRDGSELFLPSGVLPFLLFSSMAMAWASWRMTDGCLGLAASLLLAATVFVLLGFSAAVAILFVLQFLHLMTVSYKFGFLGSLEAAFIGISLGTGLAASIVLLDGIGDCLSFGSEAIFGGYDELLRGLSMMVGVASCVVVIAAILLSFRLYGFALLAQVSSESRTELDARVGHYLMGRGLSDVQSDVLIRIARGESSVQISEKLNYSRGTVNSARRDGYAILGIHSRMQLLDLLKKDIGL